MNKLAVVAVASLLSSCGLFPIGDGVMGITGSLGEYSGQACIAKVLLNSEREVRRFNLLPDSQGNFSHNFTVAPRREEYKIEIECSGKEVAAKTIVYPKELDKGFFVKFGELS